MFWFKVHFCYRWPKISLVNLWQPITAGNHSVHTQEWKAKCFFFFSKSRGLSASISFLPPPLPQPTLSYFASCPIFRMPGQNTENPILRSFFAPTPQKYLLRRLLSYKLPDFYKQAKNKINNQIIKAKWQESNCNPNIIQGRAQFDRYLASTNFASTGPILKMLTLVKILKPGS